MNVAPSSEIAKVTESKSKGNIGCWIWFVLILGLLGYATWWLIKPDEPRPLPDFEPILNVNINDTTLCAGDTLSLDAWYSHPRKFFFGGPFRWTFVFDSTRRVQNESSMSISFVPTPSLRKVICEADSDSGRVLRDSCIIRVIEVRAVYNKVAQALNGFVAAADPFSPQWHRVQSIGNGKTQLEPTDRFSINYDTVPYGSFSLIVRDEYSGCKCSSNVVTVY